jgi:uncharacterized protein
MFQTIKIMICFLALLGAGCAAGKASEKAPKTPANSGDAALEQMRLAMQEHLAEHWKESNQAIEKALRILVARPEIEIGKELASWTVSEGMRSYQGDPHELLFLHTLGMLNFAMLGDVDEGLVEARRSDELQGWMKGEGIQATDDPLARYVSAVLYESKRQWDDAYIDLVKARDGYLCLQSEGFCGVPSFLGSDLRRVALKAGRPDEARRWGKTYPSSKITGGAARGQVWLLTYSGRLLRTAAKGVRQDATAALTDGKVDDGAGNSFCLEKVYDFQPLARAGQEKKDNGSLMRDVGRMALRTALVIGYALMTARIPDNSVGIVSSGHQTEGRSWENLPSEIYAARLELPEGSHTLSLTARIGGIGQRLVKKIQVREGKIAMVRVNLMGDSPAAAASPSAKQ